MWSARSILLIPLVLNALTSVSTNDEGIYNVGVGIADCTGPSVDIGMMGYASPTQSARGIHTRLFSRAFVFESEGQSVVYVSADIGMVDQAIKTRVVQNLQAKYGPDLYGYSNVLLSGTHTHSGPAGYIQYLLYGITALGFSESSFQAIVDGITDSIERAHENKQEARLKFNTGILLEANINRSPTSYLANPEEERSQYDHNADKNMDVVRIESVAGVPLGSMNFFAVHPVSMNNTNLLISGDSKGYASMMMEQRMEPNTRPGKASFVAAFGSTNLGDVSPNIMGPRCLNTNVSCDNEESVCCLPNDGPCFVANCFASGPGKDMEDSTKIIGERQLDMAHQLFEDATRLIKGKIQHKHQFVNMSTYEVEITNSTGQKETKQLCKAALGYSFAAGTTDGPGAFDFKQGETTTNPFWELVKRFLINATAELEECQKPKPVLLGVGEAYFPYEWVPSIVETQVIRVGNLYFAAIPGELTTMAGRRMRKVMTELIKSKLPGDAEEPIVLIAGLSNVYTHYIATYEEYQKQRYEAASTLYGPHTLEAYLQQYALITEAMLDETQIEAGPTPPNLLDQQFSLVPPIQLDTTPFLMNFGDILEEPETLVRPGEEVKATFVGGHPKNNPMREGTFFTVEQQEEGSVRWKLIRTDADWDTKFRWRRPRIGSTQSEIDVTWLTPEDVTEGFYRIRHFGYYKPGPEQEPRPYQGSTSVFQIVGSKSIPKRHPLWNPNRTVKKSITSAEDFWNSFSKKYIRH